MPLQDLEKLHTSIVMLPVSDFEIKLDIRDVANIVKEPQIEALPPPANMGRITSLRDQVEITIGQGRVQILDHSDEKPGTNKLPRIVVGLTDLLAKSCGVSFRAIGFNYDVVFSVASSELPSHVIAKRFINQEAIKTAVGKDVLGGGVRFFYQKDTFRYNMYLEPQNSRLESNRFYAHLNVHIDLENFKLKEAELGSLFKREYDGFIEAVEAMIT
jgi:hypothetical protein